MKPLFESYANFFRFYYTPKKKRVSNNQLCGFKNYWVCLLDYEKHGVQKITSKLWTSFCKQANKCYFSDIKEQGKYRVSSILT